MSDSKPVSTPMEHLSLPSDTQDRHLDNTVYRYAIGSLMYLIVGPGPDLAFNIGKLSNFMECPTKAL